LSCPVLSFLYGDLIRMATRNQVQAKQTMTNEDIKKMMMSPLSQEYLESLLKMPEPPPLVVIYFTAKWCRPCNNVNLERVVTFRKDIQWMLCDVDENGYSFGYCQGKAIPSWLAIVRGKAQPLVQLSSDLDICKWLQTLPVGNTISAK